MRQGYLSEFFSGVAFKALSAVEADLFRSNQHEFNGVAALKELFGTGDGRQNFAARFIYLTDDQDAPVTADAFLTWYDARESHPSRSEYRLYFPTNNVSDHAVQGDLLIIGKRQDNSLLVMIAADGSTMASQLCWLFGLAAAPDQGFLLKHEAESDTVKIDYAARIVLDEIGVEPIQEAPDWLEVMLGRFGPGFPTTSVFSAFSRSTLPDLDPRDDADLALIAWMEREEALFRTLERHIVGERLQSGFADDVDGFLSYSLSVQNRRKSRVGHALENHLQEVFHQHQIRHTRTGVTENKSKPDFLFPSISAYHDASFPAERLAMLGVKSTCKDRWRQVLAEADRIKQKHLLTLEPGISTAQTDEMKQKQLTLVLPAPLHSTYTASQQRQLICLTDFIEMVSARSTL